MALKKTSFDEGGEGSGKIYIGQLFIGAPSIRVLNAQFVNRHSMSRLELMSSPSNALNICSYPVAADISNDYCKDDTLFSAESAGHRS